MTKPQSRLTVFSGSAFAFLRAARARQIAKYQMLAADALPKSDDADWPSVLPGLAAELVDSNLAMGSLHELLFHSAFSRACPLPEHTPRAAPIARILRRGQQAGAYAEVDPDPTADLIFAAIHQTADAIAAGGDRERLLDALRVLIRRTVAPAAG